MQKSASEYSFKSKWTHFVSKRSTHAGTNSNDQRRPSQCSDQSVSSSTSTGTLDKLFLSIPGLFRRRYSSDEDSDLAEQHKKDTEERLDQLYQTALDEISYAEDSQGSRYYPGDVASAREAMDTCAQAFLDLLYQTPDRQSHDHLHAIIAPRLLSLQSRFNALPSLSVLH